MHHNGIITILFLGLGCLFVLLYIIWRIFWGKPARDFIPILAYHKVDKKFELGGTWNTPEQFEKQMNYLKSNGFAAVTISRSVELMKNGKSRKEKYVCITFDDAYEGLYKYVWPVLKKNGYTATIFVVTGFVGKNNEWDINWGGRKFKHLDWEQIKEMSEQGIEFGSHTVSHRDLRNLEGVKLSQELSESKNILENNLKINIETLSYPFGRYDRRVMEIAQKCGYKIACSLSPSIKNRQINYMALRRSAIYITDNSWSFKNKIDQTGHWFWLQDIWCRLVNFCSEGTIIVQKASFIKINKKK